MSVSDTGVAFTAPSGSPRPIISKGTATESSYITDLVQKPWLPSISP